jgi:hypothetical protein
VEEKLKAAILFVSPLRDLSRRGAGGEVFLSAVVEEKLKAALLFVHLSWTCPGEGPGVRFSYQRLWRRS